MNIWVNGVNVPALLDTGSHVTCASKDFAEYLAKNKMPRFNDYKITDYGWSAGIPVVMANGAKDRVTRLAENMTIEVGNQKIVCDACILENQEAFVDAPILIGTQQLADLNFNLSIGNSGNLLSRKRNTVPLRQMMMMKQSKQVSVACQTDDLEETVQSPPVQIRPILKKQVRFNLPDYTPVPERKEKHPTSLKLQDSPREEVAVFEEEDDDDPVIQELEEHIPPPEMVEEETMVKEIDAEPEPAHSPYEKKKSLTGVQVKLNKKIRLRPFNFMLVEIKLPQGTLDPKKNYVLEPNKYLMKEKDVQISRSGVVPRFNGSAKFFVELKSEYNVFLSKHTRLGHLAELMMTLDEARAIYQRASENVSARIRSIRTTEDLKNSPFDLHVSTFEERCRLIDEQFDDEECAATPGETEKFKREALYPNCDILSMHSLEVGSARDIEFKINTGDAEPIKQAPRRLTPATARQVEEEIEKLILTGRIEPCEGPWASPIVVVPKKDGSVRICTDYRELNKRTKPDAGPLPRCEEMIDALGEGRCRYLSVMDLKTGYLQVPVAEEDRDKTAFVTPNAFYRYKFLPFGLRNAPAVFQRLVNKVIAGMPRSKIAVYIDDLIIKTETLEEHIAIMKELCDRLRKWGLMLGLKKCFFLRKKVEFLGHEISSDGRRPASKKLEALEKFPEPKSAAEVRRFYGLASYLRKYVRKFGEKSAPLSEVMRDDKSFRWGDEQKRAFEQIKHDLIHCATLKFPDPNAPYIMMTDASKIAIGSAVGQKDDSGMWRAVGFASRTLTKHEKRYPITELEALAVIWGLNYFKYILHGAKKVTVLTDHKAVKDLIMCKEPKTDRLYAWRMAIQGYESITPIEFSFVPGRLNDIADALSRAPVPSLGKIEETFEVLPSIGCIRLMVKTDKIMPKPPKVRENLYKFTSPKIPFERKMSNGPVEEEMLRIRAVSKMQGYDLDMAEANMNAEYLDRAMEEQEKDPEIQAVKQYIQKGIALPPFELPWLRKIAEKCELLDDVVFWKRKDVITGVEKWLLWPPVHHHEQIVWSAHSANVAGHFSREKCLAKIQENFYWPTIRSDVTKHIDKCVMCAARHGQGMSRKPEMVPIEPPSMPGQHYMMDIVKLTLTERGNLYALVLVDSMSKFAIVEAMPRQDEQTVADAFMHALRVPGMPRSILTDRGTQFTGKVMSHISERFGIKHKKTTPFHPMCDGQVERTHRTIMDVLTKMIHPNVTDWDLYLDIACWAYNSTAHSSTKMEPAQLFLGRSINRPKNSLLDLAPSPYAIGDWKTDRDIRYKEGWKLGEAWVKAVENIKVAQQRQKDAYDRENKVREPKFEVGMKVFWKDITQKSKAFTKLGLPYLGPYEIVEIKQPVAKLKLGRNKYQWINMSFLTAAKDEMVKSGRHYYGTRSKRKDALVAAIYAYDRGYVDNGVYRKGTPPQSQ